MRRKIPLLVLAWMGATALTPCLPAAQRLPRVGEPMTDFAFNDFAGRPHRLSEFAGHYVLLDFWATWCPPCRKEAPELKAASEQFGRRGLLIIGMNSDKKQEKAQEFTQQHGLAWLQSSAESTKLVTHRLKIEWYPTLILIDPGGKVLAISLGEKPPLYGPELLKTLDQMLPGKAGKPAGVGPGAI